jgi:hypothetical protein
MKIKEVVKIGIVMLVFGVLLTPYTVNTSKADTEDVTTRWIVPADTTIAVSYPNSESLIIFEPAGQDFSNVAAKSQTAILAALMVTNNGNTAVKIEGNWTTDWPTGITFVNISIGDATNASHLHYIPADETTKQQWVASLAIGANEEFWFWSSGENVAETAGVDRTLRVTSTNV